MSLIKTSLLATAFFLGVFSNLYKALSPLLLLSSSHNMRLSLTLLSLLGLSLHVHAQAQNPAALINTLQQANLTTFASALERANRSEAGQRLLSALTDGSKNCTLFAPDNGACEYLIHSLATRLSAALGVPAYLSPTPPLPFSPDICAF